MVMYTTTCLRVRVRKGALWSGISLLSYSFRHMLVSGIPVGVFCIPLSCCFLQCSSYLC